MRFDIDWSTRRVINYARESQGRKKSAKGFTVRSCREQRELADKWTAGVGAAILRYYADDVSASDYSEKEREDWQEVVEELKAGTADTLVCFEVSRMSRDAEVWGPLLAMGRRKGVIFVVDGRPYDLGDDEDEFMLKVLFLFAEREARTTSKRVVRAMDTNANQGKPHGRLPYGYRRVYNPDTGEFVEQLPHPDQAPVVQDIFRMLAAGKGTHAVARTLNEKGIPAPQGGRWAPGTVAHIAGRKGYIGVRVHRPLRGRHEGSETEAAWPGLVEPDAFWAVQRMIRERVVPRSPRKHNLLTALVECYRPDCDYRARNLGARGRRLYGCPQGHYVLIADEADEWVSAVAVALLSDPRNYERLNRADDQRIAQASAALDEALTEQKELEALVRAGQIRATLAAASDAAIQKRIDRARKEMEQATLPPVLREIVGPAAKPRWEAMDLHTRRAVLAAGLRITARPGRPGKALPVDQRLVLEPKVA